MAVITQAECMTRKRLVPRIEKPEDIRPYLKRAWRAETSMAPKDWSSDNPAVGQCAVTALIVQDLFGGGLLRGDIVGGTHYWNRLPGGREIDLTAEQFDTVPLISNVQLRSREYVLSYPATGARYRRLLTNLSIQWPCKDGPHRMPLNTR